MNLGPIVNSSDYEEDVIISPDGSTILEPLLRLALLLAGAFLLNIHTYYNGQTLP